MNLILFYLLWLPSVSFAESGLEVSVFGKKGTPMENMVISIVPNSGQSIEMPEKTYEMSQKNKTFTPHILTVPIGSNVVFPNMDKITHHVYSFSPTKKFDLKLFKLKSPDPITFDREGVVVVGCNIHDWMLGYINVIDTPYFKHTDKSGMAAFNDLPPGDYQIKVWHPRIKDKPKRLARAISIAGDQTKSVEFKLKKSLRPEPDLFDNDEY